MTDEDNPQWIYVHKAAGCPPIAHAVLFFFPPSVCQHRYKLSLNSRDDAVDKHFFPVLLLAVREDIQSP